MPVLSLTVKNAMLDVIQVAALSLHTAYDLAGANEVTGGTPPYMRLPVTFLPAAGGTKQLTGAPYTFDVPATDIEWIGMWDADSNFVGMVPNGGDSVRPFAVDDILADTIKSASHGFVVEDSLVVWGGSAGLLPAGLVEGVVYWVVAADANTLQISTSILGSAIPLTLAGNGYLQRLTVATYSAQDHFKVNALAFDANVAA